MIKFIGRVPFILRMLIVFYVVKMLFYLGNDMEFDYVDEIWWTLGCAVIASIVYTITAVIGGNAENPPFMLGEAIVNNINNKFIQYYILSDTRGVYSMNIKLDNNKMYKIYNPITHPDHLITEILAFKSVLITIGGTKANRAINKLDKLLDECRYMLENEPLTTVTVIHTA